MEWLHDYWEGIKLFFGAIAALFAWFVKDAIKNINERINHAVDIGQSNQVQINGMKLDYVLKTDFKDFKEELFNRLDRLEDIMRETRK